MVLYERDVEYEYCFFFPYGQNRTCSSNSQLREMQEQEKMVVDTGVQREICLLVRWAEDAKESFL